MSLISKYEIISKMHPSRWCPGKIPRGAAASHFAAPAPIIFLTSIETTEQLFHLGEKHACNRESRFCAICAQKFSQIARDFFDKVKVDLHCQADNRDIAPFSARTRILAYSSRKMAISLLSGWGVQSAEEAAKNTGRFLTKTCVGRGYRSTQLIDR